MTRPLTVEQVADRWGCSDNHVRNLIHRGELRAFRLGRRLIRVPETALEVRLTPLENGAREITLIPRGEWENTHDHPGN